MSQKCPACQGIGKIKSPRDLLARSFQSSRDYQKHLALQPDITCGICEGTGKLKED